MVQMTNQEIRGELECAEQYEREALDFYDAHPSTEASNEVDHARKSVRWWLIQISQMGGR